MTPQEVNTAARRRYNAVSDGFWTDEELYDIMYQGCTELATEGLLIESTFSTSSVVSQQEYAWPSNAIAIKRATYDGKKIVPIDFRDDDVLTTLEQTTTEIGVPTSYAFWDDIFYLRPVPSQVKTIKVWAYVRPSVITASSSLEIPTEWHMELVNLLLREMDAKNKNYVGATYYGNLWKNAVDRAKKFAMKRKRRDSFAVVKNVDMIYQNSIGRI